MKIAPAVRQPTQPREATTPPLLIDDFGCCRAVIAAPDSEAAWAALTDRLPPGGAELAARLTVALEQSSQATYAVANALAKIGERRRDNPPVPGSWVAKLADLAVDELEWLWRLDDAAHDAGHVGAWVEMQHNPSGGHDRPVPAAEQSWPRIARLLARAHQQVAGLTDPDRAWAALGAMDPERDADEADVDGFKARGRELIRRVVHEKYGDKETP